MWWWLVRCGIISTRWMGEGVGDGWVAELELGHFWRGPRVYVLARWAGCEAVVGQDRVLSGWWAGGPGLGSGRWAFDID